MFGWFQRLLPQSSDFFVLFEKHARASVLAAEALEELVGGGDRERLVAEIRNREHDADDIIREVLNEVRQTFLTPFDRGAIIGLIGAMDDTIDEIQACAEAIGLYEFSEFEPDMKLMAKEVLGAVRLIEQGLPMLRDITRNGRALHEMTATLVATEGEVDIIHSRGLKSNFAKARKSGDTIHFIVAREIFKHLEKIADAFEDVANQIDGLAVDHA